MQKIKWKLGIKNVIGWRLKPEILAQGGLNINERHHGYYWSLVHTHQLPGRWHLIWPFHVSVQGQRSLSAFLHKVAESSLSYANYTLLSMVFNYTVYKGFVCLTFETRWNVLHIKMATKMAATTKIKLSRHQTIYFNLDLVSTAMFRELINEARLFLVLRLAGISWIQDGAKNGSHIVI